MRFLTTSLMITFALLQYKFWWATGGMQDVKSLRESIAQTQQQSAQLDAKNQQMMANVRQLKQATPAIEDMAREKLGMVASGESYYQVLD